MSLFRRSFTAPGAAPGVVVRPERHIEPRVRVITYDADELAEFEDVAPSNVRVSAGVDEVTWIDVRGLGDGSIVAAFGERFGLHPLALSDVVNLGQRAKVDRYEDVLFFVLRMVTRVEDASDVPGRDDVEWEQISMFAGRNFVLTFQESYWDCLEPLRQRIRAGRKNIRTGGTDYLACMVVDAIVDGYFPALEHFGTELEMFEDAILEGDAGDVLSELYRTKRELSNFRRAAWPLRESIGHLLRDDEDFLDDHARLHLRDTLDHTLQIVEVNETYSELASSLADVHLSLVGQRTNDVMRVLTVVTAIFIPLSFLAGVYGMNFDTREPANLPELAWEYGYVLFWTLCVAIALGLLFLFRRLGWLNR